MKKVFLFLVTTIMAFALIACEGLNIGGDQDLERNDVEITHTITTGGVKKEVTQTFKTNPRVVATFALEVADVFKEVGLKNTGIQIFGLAKGESLTPSLNEFAADTYPNVGTLFEPNYEVLGLMIPDLIILSGRASGTYDALKEAFPNADILDVSNANPHSFLKQQEVFLNLGKLFTNLTDILNSKINEFKIAYEAISTNFPDKNVLFLMVNGDSISAYGIGSRFGFIYSELGMTPADKDGVILEAHGKTVNAEYISAVNPDIIMLFDRAQATGGSTSSLDLVTNNQLVKETKAGINKDIYILNPAAWYILPGGITSTYQMIADLNQVFN